MKEKGKKNENGGRDIINSLSKLKQSSRAPLNISGSFLLSANDISLIFAGGYMTDVANKKVRFDAFEGCRFEVYDSEVPAYA